MDEQIGYHRIQRVGITGLNFAGPAIIKFGTPEQKARYLPPIARGDVEYCQGFTEPNAGSDLASLQMRAVPDGDYYVLNGSKMFTSYYAHADLIYLLARTDPQATKHRGISLFIVEMDTPGISTRSADHTLTVRLPPRPSSTTCECPGPVLWERKTRAGTMP